MQNITLRQEALLNKLKELDPQLIMDWDEVRGIAAFVRGKLRTRSHDEADAETTIREFLEEYDNLFGPHDLHTWLRLLRSRTDDLGWTHLEFQQMHLIGENLKQEEPLEVYGSKLAAHFKPDGTLTNVQSSCWREIKVEAKLNLTVEDLHKILTKAIANVPGFGDLQRKMHKRKEKAFPIMQRPRLVVYPWQKGFRLAWTTYAYGIFEAKDPSGKPTGAKRIKLGQVFVDASTGEQFLFTPTTYAETADTGSGLGVTPLGGPYALRTLNIVRVTGPGGVTYYLKDKTHDREIITYNLICTRNLPIDNILEAFVSYNSVRDWDRVAPSLSDGDRTASQQPEVDAHFFCEEAYEWYNALAGAAGRAGWDDGKYPDPPVPDKLPIRAMTHVYDENAFFVPTCRSTNAWMTRTLFNDKWLVFIALPDGDPNATCWSDSTGFDYPAGSKGMLGHEYQHAITDFSFIDSEGNPGLAYDDGWFGAVHEGLADVFSCLFAEDWLPGKDISHAGLTLRNIAFPRDSNSFSNRSYDDFSFCGWGHHNKDHFGDRDTDEGDKYDRGTILAHSAYLMGQGGVHQRASRHPVLIPVYNIGRETVGGKDLLKAARIWYHALTFYLGTIGTPSGSSADDAATFGKIRDGCVEAAIELYGMGSLEHITTILAFYAAGLHPLTESYGADVTFLRWGCEWLMSHPYIGIDSPMWASVDLFINNGGTSEWNALVNVIGTGGNPTQFENTIYCRVRNIGDQPAQNVQIQFFYAKIGSGVVTWLPVEDKNGTAQILDVGTLNAGQSNFPDSDQNSPPSNASVKWCIPPLASGETVDHFCLRAVASCSNEVNSYNNTVQSNIAYAPYTPPGFSMPFMAGNPTKRAIPLELVVQTSLPKKWTVHIQENMKGVRLKPGEERPFHIIIGMPSGADKKLEPPFDGELKGHLFGSISGPFNGTLANARWDGQRLQGRFSANIVNVGALVGTLDGTLNALTGEVKGHVSGSFQCMSKGGSKRLCAGVEACLRPWRRVNISQRVKGKSIGGITVQVQMSMSTGPCSQKLPPTDTHVMPRIHQKRKRLEKYRKKKL